jgi:hypothetical protein
MKKLHLLILLLFAHGLVFQAKAQSLSNIPGSFVDVGFGTRPVGMGFAFVGVADDANAPYWNPAGLGYQDQLSAGFSQIDQLGLITYNYASAIVPLPGKNHSLGLTAISSGDEALTELSVHAAYGVKLNMVNVGIGLKYRNASFGNNNLNRGDYTVFDESEIDIGLGQQVYGDANGFGIDFGLTFDATERARFGVLIRDFYAPMNWKSQARNTEYQARGSYDEGMPLVVIFGSSLKVRDNMLVAADFQPATSSEGTSYVRAGLEVRLVNVLLLRAGSEQGVNDLDDEKYTLGTGIDLRVKDRLRIRSGFAYVIEPLQNSQRISFTVSF